MRRWTWRDLVHVERLPVIWRVATVLFATMAGLALVGDGTVAGVALLAVAAALLPSTVRLAIALERGDAEPLDPDVLARMDAAAARPDVPSHVRVVDD